MIDGMPDIQCGTFRITKEEGEALWASAMKHKAERAERLPTEEVCIREMVECWARLKELGWKEAMYAPKDGSRIDVIEPGCSAVLDGWRDEKGRFWSGEEGWPVTPTLFRVGATEPTEAQHG